MLHLRGSVRNLRLLSRTLALTKQFTTVRSNEIVVSEVKALANVAVKLYGKHELEAQLALLEDLREEETNKKAVVERFIEKNRALASTWLPMWISKVVCLEDPSEHVKLFPVTAPVDDKQLASTIKNKFVETIVRIRTSTVKSEGIVQMVMDASKLAETLSDQVNIDHLREIGVILENYANNGMAPALLYNGLLESGGMFASEILPILEFAKINVPAKEELKFLAVDETRSALHHQLTEELTHFLHIVHRNRFNEPSVGQAGKHRAMNRSRADKTEVNVVDRESLGYYIEHKADGGMDYIRKEPTEQPKMRFVDRYVLSVKAPCYARTKRPGQTGSYDRLNALLSEGTDEEESDRVGPTGSHDDSDEAPRMRKVVVDNLPSTITAEQLCHALRKCGPVANVWLYRDERTHPAEVKYLTLLTYRAAAEANAAEAAALANAEKGEEQGQDQDQEQSPDQDQLEHDYPGEIIDEDDEEPAIQGLKQEELSLTGAVMAAQLAAQDRLPLKHKMLKGITKTDSYAFVEMADDTGFANITKDAVRLFGIHIQNKSCRVLMAQSYKTFWVQVNQVVDVSEAIKILNEMFDGEFECYSDKESERYMPVYLQMQFEDSAECQRAFDLLLRRMEAMQKKSLAFERVTYDYRVTKDYVHTHIHLYPSWIKDSWYKEYFDRQTRAMLKKEEELAKQQEEKLQQHLAAMGGASSSSPDLLGAEEDSTGSSDPAGNHDNKIKMHTKGLGDGLGNSIEDVKRLVEEIKSMSFLAEPFKGETVAASSAATSEALPPSTPNKMDKKETRDSFIKPAVAAKKKIVTTEKKKTNKASTKSK